MSVAKNKAAQFLSAMTEAQPEAAPATEGSTPPQGGKVRRPKQSELKHIGGYFERDTVEKVAILRARLGKDNSALLKLAIDELYSRHEAKRTFGDA